MRIGCHVSVAKGYAAAVRDAHDLGADGLQYFTKNPRGFRGQKALNREDAERGRSLMEQWDVVSIGHAPYLINLASPDDELFRLSVEALTQDLVIGQARGSFGVVVHCGKPKTMGLEYGIRRMQDGIRQVLSRAVKDDIWLLLENTAGQGSEIGYTVEQLLAIAQPFSAQQVGFCLDTQHAFAAGIWDPNDPAGISALSQPSFRDRLYAVHFNDSKVPFGARKDRHQLIGRGTMGEAMLKAVLTDPRLADIPFFLETPVDRQPQYADEIQRCRQLLSSGTDPAP